VPNGDWTNEQRIKQYESEVSETYGAVTFTVDLDCADTWTTPANDNSGC
jgi:hypothetical protein